MSVYAGDWADFQGAANKRVQPTLLRLRFAKRLTRAVRRTEAEAI